MNNNGMTLIRTRLQQNLVKVKGFTLIEVLITSFIVAVLGIGILSLQILLGQSQNIAFNNFMNIEDSNKIIADFTKEIRLAGFSENGGYPLERVNNNEIIFYSDINSDQVIERIRYTFTGTTLQKGIIQPVGQPATYPTASERVKTLSTRIRNGSTPLFYYYNGDWPVNTQDNPLGQSSRLADTRTIRMYLIINAAEAAGADNFILEGTANIRILKDNI